MSEVNASIERCRLRTFFRCHLRIEGGPKISPTEASVKKYKNLQRDGIFFVTITMY